MVAGLVIVLVVVNFPPLCDGTYYGENLERDRGHPVVLDATRSPYLDAELARHARARDPGPDFASYRWGNTVDPITPGLMDRPYVARELIP